MPVRNACLSVFLTAFVLALPATARASKILLITNGDATNDTALSRVLSATGNSVTIGPPSGNFTGGDLSSYNAVVLVPNGNSSSMPDMPTSGQQSLVKYVEAGGGLVTSAQVIDMAYYRIYPNTPLDFQALRSNVLLGRPEANTGNSPLIFTALTGNPVINANLPAKFTFATSGAGGPTEQYLVPNSGAGSTVFFGTNQWNHIPAPNFNNAPWVGDGAALIGGSIGSGRVVNLSTYSDNTSLADPRYQQLLNNTVAWVSQTSPAPVALPVSIPNPVPEPTSVLVFSAGFLGLLVLAKARRDRGPRECKSQAA